MFEVHRYFVLKELSLTEISGFRIGFALINALILGKVFLVGEALHIGERFRTERLVTLVLLRTAMFTLFLLFFQSIEELIVGLIHGKTAAASLPGGFERVLMEGCMGFVVLIPFFLYTEVQRVCGEEKVRSLIFGKRPKLDAA